ncbi:hypothetical protein [Agrobacterium larrymoorei]|uniref:DUF4189 domain-containing protein n=1 Tax=Agrobacterium larrymoorei TaxID=160699 RepID=A0A4D7DMY2_9HYPH|nr:hypothetical protein [Agrobacterium larrymoorei]QCI97478.1 hypothetical protein CFBP5473_05820 [Agrobacterium larrymoorei]QYA07083.1 hypothetical protein J5285_13860 [Agrobacterium larrymoorei]
MKVKISIIAIVLLSTVQSAGAWTVCPDGVPINAQLNWSRQDRGHNEGANCGASVLANAAGVNLPGIHQVLPYGEIFKRNHMMDVAIAAYKRGYHNEAIEAAICSQVHNGAAHQCLKQNRTEIDAWFREQ